MVSVPCQKINSRGPTSVVFGRSTVLNCYYATYSGNKRVLNFMCNLKLAHILVLLDSTV